VWAKIYGLKLIWSKKSFTNFVFHCLFVLQKPKNLVKIDQITKCSEPL
jgi:hypothetical protein